MDVSSAVAYLWSPTECGGGSLWLNTFFAQAKICKHHVALNAPKANKKSVEEENRCRCCSADQKGGNSIRAAEVPESPGEYSLASNLCNKE